MHVGVCMRRIFKYFSLKLTKLLYRPDQWWFTACTTGEKLNLWLYYFLPLAKWTDSDAMYILIDRYFFYFHSIYICFIYGVLYSTIVNKCYILLYCTNYYNNAKQPTNLNKCCIIIVIKFFNNGAVNQIKSILSYFCSEYILLKLSFNHKQLFLTFAFYLKVILNKCNNSICQAKTTKMPLV